MKAQGKQGSLRLRFLEHPTQESNVRPTTKAVCQRWSKRSSRDDGKAGRGRESTVTSDLVSPLDTVVCLPNPLPLDLSGVAPSCSVPWEPMLPLLRSKSLFVQNWTLPVVAVGAEFTWSRVRRAFSGFATFGLPSLRPCFPTSPYVLWTTSRSNTHFKLVPHAFPSYPGFPVNDKAQRTKRHHAITTRRPTCNQRERGDKWTDSPLLASCSQPCRPQVTDALYDGNPTLLFPLLLLASVVSVCRLNNYSN